MNLHDFIADMNDGKYANIQPGVRRASEEVEGFSAPQLMQTISLAVSHMQRDEVYLEVGTYRGRTLCGAMADNANKSAVSVDNFSQFTHENAQEILTSNLKKMKVDRNVTFYNMDCMEFLATPRYKVGVYFYDGNHDTEPTLNALGAVIPYLSDQAIIVLDDTSGTSILSAVAQFLAGHVGNLSLLFAMSTTNFPFPNKNWWNGIVVMGWNKEASGYSATGA